VWLRGWWSWGGGGGRAANGSRAGVGGAGVGGRGGGGRVLLQVFFQNPYTGFFFFHLTAKAEKESGVKGKQ